ncbi:MAG: hypothetical protein EA404_00200 [Spirochaetaceae bacterium]|nr:MAG: hypothetical protein EA404_00200 [Spirochaetaceae bacterium]
MRLLQYLRTRTTPCSRTRIDSECDQPGVHDYAAPVAYSTLLRFFVPLAATPLMAYSTHNIIHAALARLPAPHLSLATFSVVRAACDALKAPVLVSSQVSASLVDSRRSYLLTTSLMWLLAIVIFAFLLVFGYTSLGSLFLYRVIGLRDSAAIELGHRALRILAFLPLVEVLRHSNRGVLIARQRPGIVSAAMFIRLLLLTAFVAWAVWRRTMDGIDVAAFGWTVGLAVEGFILLGVLFLIYKTPVRAAEGIPPRNDREPTLRYVVGFFIPLAVMITFRAAVQPLIQAGIARGASSAVHSLAVYGVAWSLVINLVAPLRMLHNCAIVHAPSRDHPAWPRVLRFCTAVGGAMTLGLMLLGLSPLGHLVLRHVLGVSPEIARDANLVVIAFAPVPLFWGRREAYWGVIMRSHRTRVIGIGKLINVGTLVTCMTAGIALGGVRAAAFPAVVGAAAFTMGELAETLFVSARSSIGARTES